MVMPCSRSADKPSMTNQLLRCVAGHKIAALSVLLVSLNSQSISEEQQAIHSRSIAAEYAIEVDSLLQEANLEGVIFRSVAQGYQAQRQEIDRLHQRGHASVFEVLVANRNQKQAAEFVDATDQYFAVMEEVIESVYASWSAYGIEEEKHTPVIQVPGVTMSMGGQLFFTLSSQMSNQAYSYGDAWLETLLDRDFDSRLANYQLDNAASFGAAVNQLQSPTRLDIGSMNWKQFSANIARTKAWIARERLIRDQNRLRRSQKAHADGEAASMPWTSTSLAGLGAGDQEAVPLHPDFLELALPLAKRRAAAMGSLKKARIDLAIATHHFEKVAALKATGSASQVRYDQARLGQDIAQKRFDGEQIKQQTAIKEYEFLSGLLLNKTQIAIPKSDEVVKHLAAIDYLTTSQGSPRSLIGTMQSVKAWFHADASFESAKIDYEFRQSILNRLSAMQYKNAAEIKDATFALERAKAAIEWTDDQREIAFLEARQWAEIRKLRRTDNYSNSEFALHPSIIEPSRELVKLKLRAIVKEQEALQLEKNHRIKIDSRLNALRETGSAFEFETTRSGMKLKEKSGALLAKNTEALIEWRKAELIKSMDNWDATSWRNIESFGDLPEATASQITSLIVAEQAPNQGEMIRLEAKQELKKDREQRFIRLKKAKSASVREVMIANEQSRLSEIYLSNEIAKIQSANEAQNLFEELQGLPTPPTIKIQKLPVPVALKE
ncbi:MAG: hypothetical protein AAF226_01340 [Verrucomicrobiota bacterium]